MNLHRSLTGLRIPRFLLALALVLCATPAWSLVNVVVDGDEAVAEIDILGIGVDFTLRFDEPQNLDVQSLGLTARLVNPLDRTFRGRLPDPRTSLSLVVPLMISVEPPPKRGLAFSNATEVELHTHLLPFHIDSPIRIYKAQRGGPFHDITDGISSGSIRVRGRTGGFSDFLLVVDLRPRIEAAQDKYAFLDALVLTVADAGVRTLLQADLATSRSGFDAGNYAAARIALDAFESRVTSHAGGAIPNRWRATRDLENTAGDLLTEAGSLRYVLVRLGG
jgi:hypothetical protein